MERFLLYIDILGFSQLVTNNPEKIEKIFEKVNSLDVHGHCDFQTICFSDTIVVFNKITAESDHDKELIIMFMEDFVKELLFKMFDIGVSFRAIITSGDFNYYKLKNIDYYYGSPLIDAYLGEKDINGVGLFIDKNLVKFSKFYRFCNYNKSFDFVFILQSLAILKKFDSNIPIDRGLLESYCDLPVLRHEVNILKHYYDHMTNNDIPKIRSKYLQTYKFYNDFLPFICDCLEKSNFSLKIFCEKINWESI